MLSLFNFQSLKIEFWAIRNIQVAGLIYTFRADHFTSFKIN